MMKNRFVLLIWSLCLATSLWGQDPVFSQFNNAPALLNPAFAGNTIGSNISINYRNQWPSFNNAYTTYNLMFDRPWGRNTGIGAYITADDAGDGAITTTKLGGLYSYKIQINKTTYIKGGLDVSLGQTRLDQSQLVFLDNLDPQFGTTTPGGAPIPTQEVISGSPTRSYIDIASGVLIFNPNWYAGLSFDHLNSPDIDFIDDDTGNNGQLPLRWTIMGGYQFKFNTRNVHSNVFISPNFLFVRQGDFSQLNAGAYAQFDRIFGGLWYRHSGANGDAVIGSVGVKSGLFKISYSYDYTVSELGIGSGGAHEVGIIINFDHLEKKIDYNDCLMLFR